MSNDLQRVADIRSPDAELGDPSSISIERML
jgi:hypothetical protein